MTEREHDVRTYVRALDESVIRIMIIYPWVEGRFSVSSPFRPRWDQNTRAWIRIKLEPLCQQAEGLFAASTLKGSSLSGKASLPPIDREAQLASWRVPGEGLI